ncbi:hypothetical protein D3C71_1524380 [compost metagenome]
MVFGLAGDDQRGTRLVNQDRVHLVNDGEIQMALHALRLVLHHVVAQVVKAVFVVGAVGNVCVVGSLLFMLGQLRQVDAHRQPQEVVEAAHPGRIARGQVIVHGHHMHTVARQRIQVHRQGTSQRLALTCAHFSNLAVVQRHAAQQLHIEVAHLHHALGTLADHGKRFWQDVVQRFAPGNAVLELLGFLAQLLVAQLFVLWLHRIDARHDLAVLLEQAIIATAKNFGEEIGCHANKTTRRKSALVPTPPRDRNS